MKRETSIIYLVDDEPAVLKGLSRLLRSAGFEVAAFASADEFIKHYQPGQPACLLLDLSMPGLGGLELQQWLAQWRDPLPVIFLSAHGDIPASVRAMKSGAVDFLTKPVAEQTLLNAIHEALRRGDEDRAKQAEVDHFHERLATLTPREREVLEHVISGELNKQIGVELGTTEKTIKVHRARVMEKMGAPSLAELARDCERAGLKNLPATGTILPSRSPASTTGRPRL